MLLTKSASILCLIIVVLNAKQIEARFFRSNHEEGEHSLLNLGGVLNGLLTGLGLTHDSDNEEVDYGDYQDYPGNRHQGNYPPQGDGNWNNNNRYPGGNPNQGQNPVWNNAAGVQNNQNSNQIGVPGNQQQGQGYGQQNSVSNQGQNIPAKVFQNHSPGQNSGAVVAGPGKVAIAHNSATVSTKQPAISTSTKAKQ